jgi:hypothetical protein
VRAKLTENHIQHIYKHNEIALSPTFMTLSPMAQQNVMAYAQTHTQEHQMMMQQMMQISQQAGANGKAGAGKANQGASTASGVGAIQEPFASVEATKEQGTSRYSPSM